MLVDDETYERIALERRGEQWELVCGRLRRKPVMTIDHNEIARRLVRRLVPLLSEREYSIAEGTARLRISTGTYYVPDLCVIPRSLVERARRERPTRLEVHEDPVPLVVEVWSPSTGEYDVEQKLREYQWRGDAEIWRIHPYDRALTAWRRQPDGTYTESLYTGGAVQPVALPNVTIDLDTLFD